jgi:exopolysaccharide biosynthesis predicted pyruvyltransferase EpsI
MFKENAKASQPPLEKWVRGFMDADFVVTDSFHACIFSIIFNKPFVVVGNAKRGMSRFESLLSMFSLQDHLLLNEKDYNSQNPYTITPSAYDELERLKNESMCYISEALK